MKSKNGEFLLDPRYKALVAGKSKKLYWTWENEENWLPKLGDFVFLIILLIPTVLLLFWAITSIYLSQQFQSLTIETQARAQRCSSVGLGYHLFYTYTVDNRMYEGNDRFVSWEACNQVLEASPVTIQYLPNHPEQSVYRFDDNEWSITTLAVIFLAGFFFFSKNIYASFSYLFSLGVNYVKDWAKSLEKDFAKFRRLKVEGLVIDGILISAYLADMSKPNASLKQAYPHTNKSKIVIHVHYNFLSPTGKIIKGSRIRHDSNLTEDMLPEAGIGVNILYVDDDCHMLL